LKKTEAAYCSENFKDNDFFILSSSLLIGVESLFLKAEALNLIKILSGFKGNDVVGAEKKITATYKLGSIKYQFLLCWTEVTWLIDLQLVFGET